MPHARPLLPCVLLLPPLLTAALILRFGVDLPYWDEWVHLQILVKHQTGTLTFADLFAQYNESRKPFPRLLILLLAQTGLADQRWQMAVSWLLAAFTLLMLVQLARTGERPAGALTLPWALIAAYSLAAMTVTSLGRSPFGLETALLSRYATFSLPAGIAAVALLSLLPRSRPSRIAAASLAGVLITCVVMSSVAVLPRVRAVHERQLTGRAMLTFCLTAPDAVQTTFVADWPQHPLIVPTAITLSQAGLLVPPVSPEGDPTPRVDRSAPPMPAALRGTTLPIPNRDVHSVLVVSPVPRPTVVRVLHALGSPGGSPRSAELPTLPPGAALLAVTGPDLRAVPLRLAP